MNHMIDMGVIIILIPLYISHTYLFKKARGIYNVHGLNAPKCMFIDLPTSSCLRYTALREVWRYMVSIMHLGCLTLLSH